MIALGAVAVCFAAGSVSAATTSVPEEDQNETRTLEVDLPEATPTPSIGAASWVVTDARSGEVLAGSRAGKQAPMASTTKIMTALVVLKNSDLDDEVTVSENAASYAIPDYSNAGLLAGDVLSVRELMKATLLVSGADAAVALAEHTAGDVDTFVEMMNAEAERLGLEDTRFTNPIGLDERGHHSSPEDLARLTRAAFAYREFAVDSATTYDAITTQDREIPLSNINELLYIYPAATGVKTGTTPGAGPSLVASAAAEDESYIVALLDDPDRFGSAVQLLDYGFVAFDRMALVEGGSRYDRVMVPFRRDESVSLLAERDVRGLVGADAEVTAEIEIPEELPDSARRGDRIGRVILEVDGRRVGQTALVAGRGYEEAPIWQKLWYETSRLWR